MPQYFWKDNLGIRQEITPEALSRTIEGMVHCINKKNGDLLTIHHTCIEQVWSDAEKAELLAKQQQKPKL